MKVRSNAKYTYWYTLCKLDLMLSTYWYTLCKLDLMLSTYWYTLCKLDLMISILTGILYVG